MITDVKKKQKTLCSVWTESPRRKEENCVITIVFIRYFSFEMCFFPAHRFWLHSPAPPA